MSTIGEDAAAFINSYYAKNNSIGVLDSLLINEQIIKSGMGYDTTNINPVVSDRYNTVNSIGVISSVTGKAVTLKPDLGFQVPGDPVIKINSDKAFHVGRYSYRKSDSSGSRLSQIHEEAYGTAPAPEPEPDPETP